MELFLILIFLLFCFILPSTAWSYIDPGFGGYVVSSAGRFIVIGIAFLSVIVIFCFRAFIIRWLLLLWKKYKKFCLILGVIGFLLITGLFSLSFLKNAYYKPVRKSGAYVIDRQMMAGGYNLYDGKLIDEQGRVVKQWAMYYLGIIDDNGDHYGGQVYEKKWGRYSWNEQPIWEKNFLIHHELYLSPQGTVFTFTTEKHQYNNFKVDFDVILEFDKNGHELQRYSFWEHRQEFQPFKPKFTIDIDWFSTPFQVFFKHLTKSSYDYFHINSFVVIPHNALEDRSPAFRPGNWLISLFHGSMVFILDQDSKKILWHAVNHEIEGGLQGQHSVSMLPDGNILLFENGFERKASRILKIDPLTLKIIWEYREKDFYSEQGGFVQVLPNGNFLVTESDKNRVFELTPDKKIVWEYYDPSLSDHTIYRMTRYPKEMIDRFLR